MNNNDISVPVANCKKGDKCGICIEDPLVKNSRCVFRAPYKVLAVSKDGSRYKVQGDFVFAGKTKPVWIGNLNCARLEISLVYDLGGINYFTCKNDPRGYWVRVNPITINGSMISLEFGRGVRALIAPVARQSTKARREAEGKWLDEAKNLIERYYTSPEVDFTTAKAA